MNSHRLRMVCCLLCGLGASARADFEMMGSGVRAAGMADAFAALADDPSAMHHNPAGLTQIDSRSLGTDYGEFLGNLGDGSSVSHATLRYIQPFGPGHNRSLGISLSQFQAAESYRDQMTTLSYAFDLPSELMTGPGKFTLGSTLKLWQRRYESNPYLSNALQNGQGSNQADPLFAENGLSKRVVSVDVGCLYRFEGPRQTTLGAAVSNINRPDLSLGGIGDKAPLILRAGAAIKKPIGLLSIEVRRAKRLSDQWDNEVALGGETTLTRTRGLMIALRAGVENGSRELKRAALGMSVAVRHIQLDYAFNVPLASDDGAQGDHRVGFAYSFNASRLSKN